MIMRLIALVLLFLFSSINVNAVPVLRGMVTDQPPTLRVDTQFTPRVRVGLSTPNQLKFMLENAYMANNMLFAFDPAPPLNSVFVIGWSGCLTTGNPAECTQPLKGNFYWHTGNPRAVGGWMRLDMWTMWRGHNGLSMVLSADRTSLEIRGYTGPGITSVLLMQPRRDICTVDLAPFAQGLMGRDGMLLGFAGTPKKGSRVTFALAEGFSPNRPLLTILARDPQGKTFQPRFMSKKWDLFGNAVFLNETVAELRIDRGGRQCTVEFNAGSGEVVVGERHLSKVVMHIENVVDNKGFLQGLALPRGVRVHRSKVLRLGLGMVPGCNTCVNAYVDATASNGKRDLYWLNTSVLKNMSPEAFRMGPGHIKILTRKVIGSLTLTVKGLPQAVRMRLVPKHKEE